MSKKKRSTTKREKNQVQSTIRFWVWSFENVETNQKNILLFFMFVTGLVFIVIIAAILLICTLIKLELFEYILRIIEVFRT